MKTAHFIQLRCVLWVVMICLCLSSCAYNALILPNPLEAKSAKDANALSQQVLAAVDEVVTEYGYIKENSSPPSGTGVVTLAVYYRPDGFSGRTIYISVVIGGLSDLNGTTRPKTPRTIAEVGLFGKDQFEIYRMRSAILTELHDKIKNIDFKVETKTEFTFV